MSSISIYSNGNAKSKTISIDFAADVLASSSNGTSNELRYFFKMNTSARDDQNKTYTVRIVEKLDQLALNPGAATQKQRISDTNVAYSNIDAMVTDYIYDFVHGHVANLYSSGVTYKAPMNFE